MNTFYRPGLVEMFLHGAFGRHSWFMERFHSVHGRSAWSYKCRICLIDEPGIEKPFLQDEIHGIAIQE